MKLGLHEVLRDIQIGSDLARRPSQVMCLSNQLTMPRLQLIPCFATVQDRTACRPSPSAQVRVAVSLRCIERVENLYAAPLLVLSDHADVDNRAFA